MEPYQTWQLRQTLPKPCIDVLRMAETWPTNHKKLPVKSDIPEFLSNIGTQNDANKLDRAIGDLAFITFYYLLWVGEYTTKSTHPSTKQTIQFRFRDITFFWETTSGQLCQLGQHASTNDIMTAHSTTKKLDNQKMAGKASAYINKWMEKPTTVTSMLLGANLCPYALTQLQMTPCCWYFMLTMCILMLQTQTSARM